MILQTVMNKKVILKNLIIKDRLSGINDNLVALKINGNIAEVVENSDEEGYETVDCKNMFLCPTFTDLRFTLPDPGQEEREDFESANKLATHSGYATLSCLPNTNPIIQHKSDIQYFVNKSANSDVDFLPYGAISVNLEGKELTEMFDMQNAGAIGFCNANKPCSDAGLLLRAMEYSKTFGALLVDFCYDPSLAIGGLMHEGENSVKLGLKGIPEISEYLSVKRNIELLRYSKGARLHISKISTKESVDLIRQAKKEGLNITCDVAFLNLIFEDKDLESFDSNLKLLPPLRDSSNKEALLNGLKDKTIDTISSDHTPWTEEDKEVEFVYAKNGAVTLQSLWSKLFEYLTPQFQVDEIIEILSNRSSSILNFKSKPIEKGIIESFIVIDPNEKWVLNEKSNLSKSKNSPFWNQIHTSKIKYFFNKSNLIKLYE
jgi:dihydroorotase